MSIYFNKNGEKGKRSFLPRGNTVSKQIHGKNYLSLRVNKEIQEKNL